jgi:hypothetical protein
MRTANHPDVEAVARAVLDAAFRIHTALGPGLLESAYEACLEHELGTRQLSVQKQVPMPIRFGDAYRRCSEPLGAHALRLRVLLWFLLFEQLFSLASFLYLRVLVLPLL